MNRRTFLAVAVGVAALAGCGGGGSSANPAGRGAAEGFVFVGGDGSVRLFRTAAEGRAAGLRAASGARAQIVGGSSASVGSDGRLQLSGIEPGLRTLRITPAGSGPTRDLALTVVPDAVVPLGETPVSRQAAVDAVRVFLAGREDPELLDVADILASSTPLPAGVALAPALPTGAQSDLPRTLAQASWLVYVDLLPQARFGHPTVVALVDAQSGAVEAGDSLSWPLLNGASFYANGIVNATSPDAVQVAARPPASRMVDAPWGGENATRAATCRAADPDTSRTHVLMIQGDGRSDFEADMKRVDVALSAAPFPQIGTLRKVVTFEGTQTPVARVLQEFAAVRDACKSGDTFVLFVTAHGTVEFDSVVSEEIAATYRVEMTASRESQPDGAYFRKETLAVSDLDFSPCKACRIVLWIDTCYSGNWIPLVAPQLEALPDKDILILTSADQFRAANGLEYTETIEFEGETISLPPGGTFSSSLLESLRRVREIGVAETGADALESAFSFARTLTREENFLRFPPQFPPARRRTQNPQLFRRPLDEGDVCGRGDEEVTIQ